MTNSMELDIVDSCIIALQCKAEHTSNEGQLNDHNARINGLCAARQKILGRLNDAQLVSYGIRYVTEHKLNAEIVEYVYLNNKMKQQIQALAARSRQQAQLVQKLAGQLCIHMEKLAQLRTTFSELAQRSPGLQRKNESTAIDIS